MKINIKKTFSMVVALLVAAVSGLGGALAVVAIGNGLTVSPMLQEVVVTPGEPQQASFRISNPSSATSDLKYALSVEPFYADEQGQAVYEAEGEHGDIVDWVKFDVPVEGSIEPNGVRDIIFTIDVPESAPAGGQYFSVMVTEVTDEIGGGNGDVSGDESSTTIKEIYRMAHLVYAEVTGDTIRRGEITDANVPGFLFSGQIKGVSSIKNTGNVHGKAKYTLQVFPLFSDEEVYTNVENPGEAMILPDRTVYNETAWEETPGIGVFNVVYTAEFEGATAKVEKMVVICPLWLLFLIVFVIAALIIWLVMRIRAHKKDARAAA